MNVKLDFLEKETLEIELENIVITFKYKKNENHQGMRRLRPHSSSRSTKEN